MLSNGSAMPTKSSALSTAQSFDIGLWWGIYGLIIGVVAMAVIQSRTPEVADRDEAAPSVALYQHADGR